MGRPIAFAAALLVLAAGCGGAKPKGFLDPRKLERDIRPEGTGVSDLHCVRRPESGRKFDCRITLSNGDGATLKRIVSRDGKSWSPRR